jgi:ribosomal protein S18 acetylase RimI-like enzyme
VWHVLKADDELFRFVPELGAVSEIIMESFYDSKTKASWGRLYQLGELNRLQQNFPYTDPDLHRMLVAVTAENKEVVGFCDADARPCQTKPKLPRPYLSDLAVHPDHRRRGIAKALVKASEEFVRGIPRTELFIRVEETNEAAVTMYDHLEYQTTGSEDTKDKGTILILHKEWDTDSQTSLVESSSDSEIAI